MIKLNEMLFKQRIEISPQIVCGINNVIILHINNAGTATQKQGLITFLSNSFILMIETFDASILVLYKQIFHTIPLLLSGH